MDTVTDMVPAGKLVTLPVPFQFVCVALTTAKTGGLAEMAT